MAQILIHPDTTISDLALILRSRAGILQSEMDRHCAECRPADEAMSRSLEQHHLQGRIAQLWFLIEELEMDPQEIVEREAELQEKAR